MTPGWVCVCDLTYRSWKYSAGSCPAYFCHLFLFSLAVAGNAQNVTCGRICGWTWQMVLCCVASGSLMAVGGTGMQWSTTRRRVIPWQWSWEPSPLMEQVSHLAGSETGYLLCMRLTVYVYYLLVQMFERVVWRGHPVSLVNLSWSGGNDTCTSCGENPFSSCLLFLCFIIGVNSFFGVVQ